MTDTLVRVEGACGRITLNRPRAINALSSGMVTAMCDALTGWASDPRIRFVLLDGAGDRGLCAGGDIRAMHTAVTAGELEPGGRFFRDEYRLNFLIARYPKPFVVLMDGFVMGGGIGVSALASHRVVTERSEIAMPESIIGFVPDAGGSHLLGAAPGEFGTYLGLTGNRFGAADGIALGFADLFVPAAELAALREALERCGDTAAMEACLRRYAAEARPEASLTQQSWIGECFARDTVEEILAALARHSDPGAAVTLAELATRSPTSLKVTLRALRNTRRTGDLAFSLRQEYRISNACIREHDFVEGVRAAIVDKDRKPQWRPARLEEVGPELVARHFAVPEAGELDLAFDLGAPFQASLAN